MKNGNYSKWNGLDMGGTKETFPGAYIHSFVYLIAFQSAHDKRMTVTTAIDSHGNDDGIAMGDSEKNLTLKIYDFS